MRSTRPAPAGSLASSRRRGAVGARLAGRLVGMALAIAVLAGATACAGGTGSDGAGSDSAGSDGHRLAATTRAQVGSPAPAYSARNIAGDSVSLAGQHGRVVLLNIWATWCHPCRTEIPELQALYEREQARGLEVVGVSVDASGEDAAVADFGREYGVTYPLWRDPDGRVSTTFAAVGVPATYLIDRDGILRWSHLGPVTANDPALIQALEEALGKGS